MKELNHLPGDPSGQNKSTNAVTVKEIIESIPEGELFDAREILNQHPHLANNSVAYVELVIEQYCRTLDSGQHIDRQAFARRYETHIETLTALIETEALIRGELDEPNWPEAGEEYLGFQLDLELGGGRLSRVFLAREIDLANRHVVVKVCSGDHRESDVLGNLNHRSICRVYSVRHDPTRDLSTICMPFEGAATLADLIVEGPPESTDERRDRLKRLLGYAVQTADALAYLHDNQVVHSDVKPANILIANDDARLIDFNVSFREGSTVEQLYGTLQYLAPEHLNAPTEGATGRRGSTDGDIYAWGRTFFQAVHGRLPDGRDWNSEHDLKLETEREFRSKHPQRILTQELPREFRALDRLLSDCLAADTAARPSAKELVRRLKLIETQSLAKPKPHKPVSTNRRVAITVGLFAVVFGVVLFFASQNAPGAKARLAIDQHRYKEAIAILEPLVKDPKTRNDDFEEVLAYAYAQQAILVEKNDKKSIELLRKATAILERLTAKLHGDKKPAKVDWSKLPAELRRRYESLGKCRIEILKRRPALPTNNPPLKYKQGFEALMESMRRGHRGDFQPDMRALGDCLAAKPNDISLNFWVAMFYRMIVMQLPKHKAAKSAPTRALEYLWTGSRLTGGKVRVAERHFRDLSVTVFGWRDTYEFQYVVNRGFKPPKLTLPPKP